MQILTLLIEDPCLFNYKIKYYDFLIPFDLDNLSNLI